MAVAGGTQALIATFAFGLVALASAIALYRFTAGKNPNKGDAPIPKWLRLVLITFLLSSALWSIMDFAATLTSGDANPACQILIVIAASFDQLARVAFEEFLLLRINLEVRSNIIFLLQFLMAARFVMAGVLVAVQRPQDFPVCIAKSILVPFGIATLITDVLIVCILFVLIWQRRESIPPRTIESTKFAPAKILTFLTAGFAAWLATSIPLIFGLEVFAFATRTVVPSIGLLVLIGLVLLFRCHILFTKPTPPTSLDNSKALPSPPVESRDTDPPPDVFNRPLPDGGQPLHIAQTQRPGTGPLPLLKPGSRATSTTLLVMNTAAPNQAKPSVDGMPVRGQLFPPIRAATAPIVLQNPPKRQPKGKLAISNPVIRESTALKIENTIATTDLAIAAKMKQEEKAAASRALPADRAGQSQTLIRTIQETSFKRKDASAANSVPAMLSERPLLQPKASTTATQVSPGADELRRRSPRGTLNTSKMVMSPPARSPRRPSRLALDPPVAPPPAIPPQSPLRKNGSGQSVLRETSGIFIDPGTPPQIPTPLRQENSNWPKSGTAESPLVPRVEPLPMPLPKMQPNTTSSTSYKSTASSTVRASLLARGGPGSVRRDIRPSRQRPDSREAEKQQPAPAKTPVQLRAANGIPVNPRAQPSKDLADETGERGKALMFSSKLEADGAEETVSRQILSLSLANTSPSTDSIVHRPRPIPRKRSIYKAEFTIKVSPTAYRHRLSRSGGSVELQRASLESSEGDTISRIPSFPEPPRSAGAVVANYLKISDNANKTVTPGSLDEFYSSGVSYFADSTPYDAASMDPKTAPSESTEFGSRTSMEPEFAYNVRRQSSPVLPVEEMRHVSMLNPTSLLSESSALLKSVPSSARSSPASQHDGDEIVPLILDTDPESSFSGPSSQRNSLGPPAGWHRRVGDACPTFSDRKNGEKSPRRVLAPTPLLLGRSSRPTRVAESPAPPLESPQHALDIIQQQLRDLDEADSEPDIEDKQRRRLLENLEAEMGAQETQWQDLRRNLAERSPSSTRSSRSPLPSGDLHLTSPRPSPVLRSPDLGSPVIGRGMDPTSATENHTKTPADEKSDPALSELTRRSNSGFTDPGSAQAIFGEVENRAKLGKSESRNKDGLVPTGMTSDISALRQPENYPTASDTNKAEEDVEKNEQLDVASAKNYNFSTWTEPRSVNFASPLPVSHWSIDSDTAALASETLQQAQDIAEEPGNLVRKSTITSPLIGNGEGIRGRQSLDKAIGSPTSSSSLPRENLILTAVSEQTQSPHRPVTQRPPRRSKRITLLPDIPESPKPLSSKHDTLGFFRFPWGETSDIATLQPQLSSAFSVPLPGATLNEFPLAQPFLTSQGPVLPSQVYPASFFDHYSDDELPAADSDEGYSDDEDEAFDETTLWEIANLLRSSAVPSRDSLFPGSEEYRPPSRAGFASVAETTVLAVRHLPTAVLEDSTLGSKNKALPSLPPPDSSVWTSNTMYTTITRSAGLAQPDAKTWKQYLGKQDETLRAAPRKSEPASITSNSLWAPSPTKAEPVAEAVASGLWQSPKEAPLSPVSTAPSTPFLASPSPTEFSMNQTPAPVKTTPTPHGLWTPPAPVARVFFGLPQEEGEWGRYTAKKVQSSRPKPRSSAQDVIRSTSLWTNSKAATTASAPSLAPVPKPILSIQLLWSKPAAVPAERTEGLWSASHIRDQYKTTDKRPAALDTARKLRIDRRPLATLRSASLWSTTTQTPTRQVPDWFALSTTLRPVSPGGASTISDQDYSSVSDTYSLRSEVTSASSVAASKQPAYRKMASQQAAQEELDAAFRDVMQSRPVIPEAVAEEEVIEQQQQQEKKLEEKEELFFDSSRFHPVFAVDVLHVTSDNVHPAATGYLHCVVNGAPKPRRR